MYRRVPSLLLLSLAAACGGDDSGSKASFPTAMVQQAVSDYKTNVNASYADVVAGAQALKVAVDAFVAAPSQASHDAAKAAWIAARLPFAPSEAFRFYDGPIDNPVNGPEPEINSWPLDENYIDYTRDDPSAGIINDLVRVPVISAAAIDGANAMGGEKNISDGFHAIEFLLWGQDDLLPGMGAGKRPFTDYVVGAGGTAANQARRGQYLQLATDALLGHLTDVAAAWAPGVPGNYASTFGVSSSHGSDPGKDFIAALVRSIGAMAKDELSGQRMAVPYASRDQEDEHSCFSDTTANDLFGDGTGLQNVWLGRYTTTAGVTLDGVGLDAIVNEADPALASKTTSDLAAAVAQLQVLRDLQAMNTPFDVILKQDDSSPGRTAMLAGITALRAVAADMEQVNSRFSLGVDLSKVAGK